MTELASLIDRLVIIVKENHTFNNYFGTFPGANGAQLNPAQNPPLAQSLDAHLRRFAGHQQSSQGLFLRPALIAFSFGEGRDNLGQLRGYAFKKYIKELAGHPCNHGSDLFAKQAAAGCLPTVSWVYADDDTWSEHPPNNVTEGMQWTVHQIQAITDGGLWCRTAIFVTWDDWGGWFDHVKPPNAERWDIWKAQRPKDYNLQFSGQEFRYGSRVPCLVISPYAKPCHVFTTLRSHISLEKFVQTIFNIESINPRLNAADNMLDCFDPDQTALPSPRIFQR